MGLENPLHLAILFVIILLLFGARRLPELGKSLGEGMRGFKDSISGEDNGPRPALAPPPPPAATAPATPPVAVPVPAPPPAVAVAGQPPAAGEGGQSADASEGAPTASARAEGSHAVVDPAPPAQHAERPESAV